MLYFKYFSVILLLFMHLFSLVTPLCNDYSSDDDTCSSCSYQTYSLQYIINPFSRIPASSCLPKDLANIYNKTVFIQPGSSCGSLCDGTSNLPYPDIFSAFLAESQRSAPYAIDSYINFLLVGGPHYLLRKMLISGYFGFFRKQRLIIKIRPALCSETILSGCYEYEGMMAMIYVKTDEAFIFNSGTLLVENIIFNASDLHLQTGNDASALYNQEIMECDLVQIMNSSNSQCYISSVMINRLDENSWLYPYGLFTNELIFDLHQANSNAYFPNLTIKNCEFHSFHSVKAGFGFLTLIKISPHPNVILMINTTFKAGFLFNGLIANRPAFDYNEFPTNTVQSNITLMGCIIKDYNKIQKQQSNQNNNGIINLLNSNRNLQIVMCQIINILLLAVNSTIAYNPLNIGHSSFYYEDITSDVIGYANRIFLIDGTLFQNLKILAVFKLTNLRTTIDTMILQNSQINIGNFQYFLFCQSYSLLYNNNTMQATSFNHALRFDLNVDYNPSVIIINSSFLSSVGWYIDNNAYPYNSLLSYNNLTAQTRYYNTYWEISNCLLQGMYQMAFVEGRKSFVDTFIFRNNTILNYSRVNLQWSMIGIGPFQKMLISNIFLGDSLSWEFVNVRWSPIETLLTNLTFNNSIIQALFHIRIIYTPSQYFTIVFRNISIGRLTNLPNSSNVMTNMIVDHAQPGLPNSAQYVPTLILRDCNFHITVISGSFLEMYKFLFPVHLEFINCLFDYHGPMVLSLSLFTYVPSFVTRFIINGTYVYNDAYTTNSLNSQGLAVIGHNITFENSSFIQRNSQDFLYTILASNLGFVIKRCYFQNWVFNIDGLSWNLLISDSLFNLTVISNKLNSQHLQLSNKDGANANYSQIIENTLFIGQPIQGGFLLKQASSLTIYNITIMNPASQRPSLELAGMILAQSESVLIIKNSKFLNCWASLNEKGGCIYSEIQTKVMINNTNFTVGTSYYGGFLFAMNSMISIYSSQFQAGYSQKGAGVFSVGGSIILSDCSFINNTANKSGGHLYFDQTEANIIRTTFSLGNAVLSGAVLDSYNLISLTIDSCSITNNTSLGLAVLLIKSGNAFPSISIINTEFNSNIANQYGCLLIKYANFQLINSTFYNNHIGISNGLINILGKTDNYAISSNILQNLLIYSNFGSYILSISCAIATLQNITLTANKNTQDLIQFNIGVYILVNFTIFNSNNIDNLFIITAKSANSISISESIINGEGEKSGFLCDSCLIILIDNSRFLNCFSNLQGAAIYLTNCQKTTIQTSFFVNNSAIFNAAGIYLEDSILYMYFSQFFENSLFNQESSLASVDIYAYSTSENYAILQIFACNFNNSLGNSQILFFQYTSFFARDTIFVNCTNTNAIYCSDCKSINLQNCSFLDFINASSFVMKNTLNTANVLMIFDSFFQGNSDNLNGGAIKLIGYLQGQINNSSFVNNIAENGVGGAIYYSCQSDDFKCNLLISESNFTNNIARLGGGAIKIEGKTINFQNNVYMNNLAVNGFGNNLASIPRKLLVFYEELPNSGIQLNLKSYVKCIYLPSPTPNDCVNFNNLMINIHYDNSNNGMIYLKSGYAFIVFILMIDDFSQYCPPADPEYSILISKTSPNIAKIETNSGTRTNNTIVFPGLNLIGKIDSFITLSFQNNGVSYLINATFNSCSIGDIVLNQRCITCSPGFYSFLNNDSECIICDSNAKCLGGASLIPDPGFWRNELSSNILQCPIKDACPNHNNSMNCKTGSMGRTCSICEEGYGLTSDGQCNNCTSSANYYLKMLISSIYVILFICLEYSLVRDGNKKEKLVNILKIGINHTQLLMILAKINLAWETLIKDFFDYQMQVSPMPPDSFSWDCVVLQNIDNYSKYIYRLWMQTLAPLIYCIIIVIGLMIYYWRKSKQIKVKQQSNFTDYTTTKEPEAKITKKNRSMRKEIKTIMVIIVYNFYVILVLESLSIFDCLSFPEDNVTKYFLAQYPQMECFQQDHYQLILGFFVPTAVFWIIGIPLFLLSEIKSNPTSQDKYNTSSFLTNGFKEKYKYWELIGLFRKFILALFAQLLVLKDKLLAANTFVLILALFFFAFERIRPYHTGIGLNMLESSSYMTILIIVHLVLASSDNELSSYFNLFYGLIILMMLIFYLIWLWLFLNELYIFYLHKYFFCNQIFRMFQWKTKDAVVALKPVDVGHDKKIKELEPSIKLELTLKENKLFNNK